MIALLLKKTISIELFCHAYYKQQQVSGLEGNEQNQLKQQSKSVLLLLYSLELVEEKNTEQAEYNKSELPKDRISLRIIHLID